MESFLQIANARAHASFRTLYNSAYWLGLTAIWARDNPLPPLQPQQSRFHQNRRIYAAHTDDLWSTWLWWQGVGGIVLCFWATQDISYIKLFFRSRNGPEPCNTQKQIQELGQIGDEGICPNKSIRQNFRKRTEENEDSSLPDKEYSIIDIKMLTELRERMDEHNENFKKENKRKQQ